MGLFDFLRKEEKGNDAGRAEAGNLTSDVEFEKMSESAEFTIENQEGSKIVAGEVDLHNYIEAMLEDEEQFVTLVAPRALEGIRYVQACFVENGIDVEIGVEDGEATKLYSKLCGEAELREIFTSFYHGTFCPDKSLYEPVQFYC